MPVPKGFTLDAPASGKNLPPGFTLDAPQATPPAPVPNPTFTQEAESGLKNFGIGMLKGAGGTLNALGSLVYPDALARRVSGLSEAQQRAQDAHDRQLFAPRGTAQNVGRDTEQAGEFLIPGMGEDAAVGDAARFLPETRFLKPLLHVGFNAATGAGLNKLQGGSAARGAELGAGGSVFGQAIHAAAPGLMELTQGIDTPGRRTGKALLNETHALTPGLVTKSANRAVDRLAPQLNEAADRASVKPNAAIGMLTSGRTEIPLAAPRFVPGKLTRNTVLYTPNDEIRKLLPAGSLQTPMSSYVDIFPDQLPNAEIVRPTVPPSAVGTGFRENFGQIPGDRGGFIQNSGVMFREPEVQMGPMPATIENRSIPMAPFRRTAQKSVQSLKAEPKKIFNAARKMGNQLTTYANGEPVPDSVTPRELLNLKRGIGHAASWKPSLARQIAATRNALYGQMNDVFETAVPEAKELNRRISALIPATMPGSNYLPLRIISPIGGASIGGYEGYMRGGPEESLKGALLGALVGTAVRPGMNAASRLMWSPITSRLATGAALQALRPQKEK